MLSIVDSTMNKKNFGSSSSASLRSYSETEDDVLHGAWND